MSNVGLRIRVGQDYKELNISSKRAGMMIKGIQFNNKEMATEVGILDKVSDFLKRIDFPKVFDFLKTPSKQQQLNELYDYLKTNAEINFPKMEEAPFVPVEDPDLRLISVCIVIRSIITDKAACKFELERTESGFHTGKLTCSIHDQVIFKSNKLDDMGYSALLHIDEICNEADKLKIDPSNPEIMKDTLEGICKKLATNIPAYQNAMARVTILFSQLHYKLHGLTKLLEKMEANNVLDKEKKVLVARLQTTEANKVSDEEKRMIEARLKAIEANEVPDEEKKVIAAHLQADGKIWEDILKTHPLVIKRVPKIAKELASYIKSIKESLSKTEYEIIIRKLVAVETDLAILLQGDKNYKISQSYFNMGFQSLTKVKSSFIRQKAATEKIDAGKVSGQIELIIKKAGDKANIATEVHFTDAEETAIGEEFIKLQDILLFSEDFGKIPFNLIPYNNYLSKGDIHVPNQDNVAQTVFIERKENTDIKYHHPYDEKLALDIDRSFNIDYCEKHNLVEKKMHELFNNICGIGFNHWQKRLFHETRARIWGNQPALYGENTLNLDDKAAYKEFIVKGIPTGLNRLSKIVRSSIACRGECFQQAALSLPELQDVGLDKINLETLDLETFDPIIKEKLKQMLAVRNFILDRAYAW